MENKNNFKVGDKVRIKSVDWFRNKGIFGCCMTKCYGEVVTIKSGDKGFYRIKEDGGQYCWIDEMIEGLVEEETKPKYEDEVNGEYYSTPKYLVRPSGYQFVDENGNVINAMKITLEKKKKEYPKTYEECCQYLGCDDKIPLKIIGEFTKLINARNAYWKIAGEEMGLGKPWEPDWNNANQEKYTLEYADGQVYGTFLSSYSKPFTFPTEEMRDAFYENFKKEIEICKELL